MQTQTSTTQQLDRLIEFRRAVYENAFRHKRDAQFELLDALTAQAYASYALPELSLSPFFRRQRPSVYMALKRGRQG